ncbi:MerR family transcriptional regulator [Lactobacillus sp. DCY120]|uniref:MerR family transcriptional regulator n=1 Tax=Bombilactobacillus apium TaxID=2675299 RepID=A0A850R0R9_9LACO|nr:MerR family transcriptional regulator [Bombilactobacillus apium]NVY95950.1 MerR family transcriptional regulator [Bombilactobacillus apium]
MTKTYSIGQAAQFSQLTISTLRYYDQLGLIPNLQRDASGQRLFTATNLEAIAMISCLKNSGMKIKAIRQFMDWCQEGDSTLKLRLQMFQDLQQSISQQLAQLQQTLAVVNYKCAYYQEVVNDGTEAQVCQRAVSVHTLQARAK